jgi:hypothetical protein
MNYDGFFRICLMVLALADGSTVIRSENDGVSPYPQPD